MIRLPYAAGLLPATILSVSFLAAAPVDKPTFHKDVTPILQKNCQGCHRAGEAAPMPLITYKETRPFAAAIKQSVTSKRMPPWSADPAVGKFHNDRSLSSDELQTLTNWVNSGAKEGNAKDAPAPMKFAEGWAIGKPDVTIEMAETFPVPASGTIEYHYVVLPTGFTEDKWISAAETRPMNRAVNHHIIAYVREPGSKWLADAKYGVPFIPAKGRGEAGAINFLTGYAPGTVPDMMKPGQGKLIKAGSDIVFQIHWTANGKESADKAKLGLIFAKETITHKVMTLAAQNGRFTIPPGADNHQVDAKITLQEDSVLEAMTPHMHMRGKAFAMRVTLPNGEKRELLNVPKYDFMWQLSYALAEPLALPKGSIIEATAWYDNSPNNKYNPDPTKAVKWGDQSWEEMMIGFFNVVTTPDKTPMDLMRPKKAAPAASSSAGVQ